MDRILLHGLIDILCDYLVIADVEKIRVIHPCISNYLRMGFKRDIYVQDYKYAAHIAATYPRVRFMLKDKSVFPKTIEKFSDKIIEMHFNNNTVDADILNMANFSTLETLSVYDCHTIENYQFEKLSLLTSLRISSGVSRTDFKHCENLRSLTVYTNGSFTNEGLAELTKLTHLTLGCYNLITDVGISNLISLEVLDISYNNLITNAGISELVNLRELNLDGTENVTVDSLKKMSRLEKLVSSGLIEVKDCTLASLTSLDIRRYCNYNFDFLAVFNLVELRISTRNCLNVKCWDSLTNLTGLYFYSYMVSVVSHKKAKSYDIPPGAINHCKKLEILHMDNCVIPDEDIQQLFSLRSLRLCYNSKVTDATLRGLTNLTHLMLEENDIVTDKGLCALVKLSKLEMTGSSSKITDAGLLGFTNLTSLSLEGNRHLDDKAIGHLTDLIELDLYRTKCVTYEGVSLLTNLISLRLSECSVFHKKDIVRLQRKGVIVTLEYDKELKLLSVN
ncbi:MAG: hypothetical protein Harvfovirus26_16 [Harvfovirus sp.]|uniref:Leucine-rich repeat protein n=1 Tax=Harvfovirus sp. TaxID=2487768 RepID=A0A3G5A252_9VIRU|nr:MAG: hypothetical protein Harvfovirus26_16 [Harvfovirus sp.]